MNLQLNATSNLVSTYLFPEADGPPCTRGAAAFYDAIVLVHLLLHKICLYLVPILVIANKCSSLVEMLRLSISLTD